MLELWNSIPVEVKAAGIVIVVWLVDWAVTKTPNPIDNMIWRWIKSRLKK